VTQTTAGSFCKCSASSVKGGYYAFQGFGHCQRTRCDAAGHACMGSKQYERKDAWSHHAKDTPGEKHRTGSIRICARPPQAQVPFSIGISTHAEPYSHSNDHWHAHALKGRAARTYQNGTTPTAS